MSNRIDALREELFSEIDEYTGKPYDVDVGHVLAARKLWQKYNRAAGSSERAFIHVIAPVLAKLTPRTDALGAPSKGTCRAPSARMVIAVDAWVCEDCGANQDEPECRYLHTAIGVVTK